VANQLAANPWTLDTEGAIYTGHIRIKTIHWAIPVAAGDELLLLDRDGNTIVTAVAEADGQSQIFRLGAWYNGLTLDTLDSGTVLVHFR
jgi:hypothetical protein